MGSCDGPPFASLSCLHQGAKKSTVVERLIEKPKSIWKGVDLASSPYLGHPKKSLCQCWGACPCALALSRTVGCLVCYRLLGSSSGAPRQPKESMFVITVPCWETLDWGPRLTLWQLGTLQRSLGSVPQGFNADDIPAHVSPLAHQMDFPLVPVVHGEGQHVGCSNFSSIPGGRGSLIHLTGTIASPGVPEEMLPTTQKKSILTLLLNVCQLLGVHLLSPRLPSSEAP